MFEIHIKYIIHKCFDKKIGGFRMFDYENGHVNLYES